MKNFSKDATRRGYQILYSIGNLIIDKRPKLDRRYTLNKEILYFVKLHQLPREEKKRILNIKRTRSIAKCVYFQPVSQNKLYVDYKNNKSYIKSISDNCIHFYGRNHWAKSDADLRVLSILRKHFYNQ